MYCDLKTNRSQLRYQVKEDADLLETDFWTISDDAVKNSPKQTTQRLIKWDV